MNVSLQRMASLGTEILELQLNLRGLPGTGPAAQRGKLIMPHLPEMMLRFVSIRLR